MLNIDEQAVEVIKCDLIKNGLFPECQFGFQTCSFNVTSFDFSAYYMAQCPLINSSSNYHIDSVAKQIGLAEDLEICTSKYSKYIMLTVLISVLLTICSSVEVMGFSQKLSLLKCFLCDPTCMAMQTYYTATSFMAHICMCSYLLRICHCM